MTSRSSRRLIIHKSSNDDVESSCLMCGEPLILAEQAAKLVGINQRRIFQLIENGEVHFSETDAGTTLVCIASMAGDHDVNELGLGKAE